MIESEHQLYGERKNQVQHNHLAQRTEHQANHPLCDLLDLSIAKINYEKFTINKPSDHGDVAEKSRCCCSFGVTKVSVEAQTDFIFLVFLTKFLCTIMVMLVP